MINFHHKLKSQEKRNYFITSDLHFFHRNIMSNYPLTRPWATVEEMNEALIAEWNALVTKNDVVISGGDFSFGNKVQTEDLISRLNGYIVHVLGNHSKVLRKQMNETVYDHLEFKYDTVDITVNHYSLRVWNKSGRGAVHFFGHSHGNLEGIGRSMDVGYDAHGRILRLDEAIAVCMEKDIHKVDHH